MNHFVAKMDLLADGEGDALKLGPHYGLDFRCKFFADSLCKNTYNLQNVDLLIQHSHKRNANFPGMWSNFPLFLVYFFT